jgi:hypothetical protein
MTRRGPVIALGLLAIANVAHAQGYRLRLDNRVQRVSFRGVQLDSIPASAVVAGSSGGDFSPDGFAVNCSLSTGFCYFFRPGDTQRAAPAVTAADMTVWGLGVPGLSLHGSVRLAMDLGDAEVWPGTNPNLQLLEGYADYSSTAIGARVGRQVYTSRLGFSGFDGGRLILRDVRRGFDAVAYLGQGLARGIALPVTSNALNPLDDFQPRDQAIMAGGALGYSGAFASLRLDYQREVDPGPNYFVSERGALAGEVHPWRGLTLLGGAEYDLAQDRWGSADASLGYTTNQWSVTTGVMRYRPHFELWTIWGAFSPVAYHAITGSASYSGIAHLQLRGRASRFWYEDTETETPLVNVEDRGWRFSVGATWDPFERWSFELGHEAEFGPGASFASYDAGVSFRPRADLSITAHAARLTRPLEFRFDEATLDQVGLEASWRPSERWQLDLSAARYLEERDRPDPARLDWDQTRLTARLVLLVGSADDLLRLPKGRRPTTSGSRTP